MYKVIKGFTSEKISASKGKIIDIKDKKIAKNLINAGLVETISNKEISNSQKDKDIKQLKSEVEKLEQERKVLIDENIQLKKSIELLNSSIDKKNETEEEDDLDDKKDEALNKEIKENNEESNEDDLDDKTSSK